MPGHSIYDEGKIAAQAVIPSVGTNLNDIECYLNCGLSKHSYETCFKNCLHCPLGILSHKYWTLECVFKARVLHQSQIARSNKKSAKQATIQIPPPVFPVFQLDQLTKPLSSQQFPTLKLLLDTLAQDQMLWTANNDS